MNALAKEWRGMGRVWSNEKVKAFLIITTLQNLGTGWFFGTYTLFLLHSGLSLFQANLLNTIFMATDVIFNPYTGKLADKFGQKKIFVTGQVFWFAGMFVYGVGNSFWWFAAAEMISAVGSALMSDALESWLRNVTPEDICHEALSHSGSLGSLGVIPSAVLGGIIGAKFGLQWPWLASAGSGVVVTLITIMLLRKFPDSYREAKKEVLSVAQVAKLTFETKALRYVALITFGYTVCTQPFNMFWSPILQAASGASWWLGSVWIGISVVSAIGSYWARKQSNGPGMVKMIVLTSLPILLTPWIKAAAPLTLLYLAHEFGRGAYRPITFTYANRHIPDQCRSTANSIQSAMKAFGAATGLLISGALTLVLPPIEVWFISAAALLGLAAYAEWKR